MPTCGSRESIESGSGRLVTKPARNSELGCGRANRAAAMQGSCMRWKKTSKAECSRENNITANTEAISKETKARDWVKKPQVRLAAVVVDSEKMHRFKVGVLFFSLFFFLGLFW